MKFDLILNAVTGSFSSGVNSARQSLNRLGEAGEKAVGGIGRYFGGVTRQVAGFLGATFLVQKALQSFSDAGITRDRSGPFGGIQKFQEYQFIAKQTSAAVEDYAVGLKTTARTQIEALKGNQDLLDSYQRLGVTVDDLKKLKGDQVFDLIASKQKGAKDSSILMADAMKVLGDSAEKILPGMIAGFDDLRKQAQEAGIIVKNDTIEALAAVGDEMTTLSGSIKNQFASTLLWLVKASKTSFNAIRSEIKQLGAFWGTVFGGGTFSEASIAADKVEADFAAEVVKQEQAFAAYLDARKKAREAGNTLLPDIARPSTQKAAIDAGINADNLQKIGLFVGNRGTDPNIALLKEQNDLLRQQLYVQQASERALDHLANPS